MGFAASRTSVLMRFSPCARRTRDETSTSGRVSGGHPTSVEGATRARAGRRETRGRRMRRNERTRRGVSRRRRAISSSRGCAEGSRGRAGVATGEGVRTGRGTRFRSHLSDAIAWEELAFVPVGDGEALLAVVEGVDVTQTDRLVEDNALFLGEERHGRAIVGFGGLARRLRVEQMRMEPVSRGL